MTLLVQNNDNACYKCLKPKHDGVWRYEPRQNPKNINLVTENCGEASYVPYGVSGSVIAASLACSMALDWANKKYSPRLRTMRIDVEATKPVNNVNAPLSAYCPCCSEFR